MGYVNNVAVGNNSDNNVMPKSFIEECKLQNK